MPGMNSGLSPTDPTLVGAFRSALLHQGAIALITIVFLSLVWATARTWSSRWAAWPAREDAAVAGTGEPRGRWLLRTGFGVLWIFDGLLQAQPKMAGGLAAQVIEPTAASSPAWVQHLVSWGSAVWSYHPVPQARPPCGPGRHRRLAHRLGPRRLVPGWRGRPVWPGGWSCGCSVSRSAGYSHPA